EKRTCSPPRTDISGSRAHRNGEDLNLDPGARICGGEAEAAEQLQVRAQLELVVPPGPQVAVAQDPQREHAVRDRERLVLGHEGRQAARGAIRGAQLELAHLMKR